MHSQNVPRKLPMAATMAALILATLDDATQDWLPMVAKSCAATVSVK